MRAWTCGLAAAWLMTAPALAAEAPQWQEELQRLKARIEALERQNAELQKQQLPAGATGLDERVRALESQTAQQEQALEGDRLTEKDPELITRLKVLESEIYGFRQHARRVEALEGISVGGGLTLVAQQAPSAATDQNASQAELNYRADATISLPAGQIGSAEGFLFTHFRLGQGAGLDRLSARFAAANASAFQHGGSGEADALLAQAWYQLDVPLPFGGFAPRSRSHLELNLGKMDPFLFFDQNAAADDETRRFLNSAFVHNPLLDAGGDIGADDFGFTPGARVAYVNEQSKPLRYGLSLGVFGTGDGAAFQDSLSSPLLLIQAETEQRLFGGLPGNYRLYAWRNGRGVDLDGSERTHSGFGISADQRIGDGLTLFGRYGQQHAGAVLFDRALTVGGEWNGSYWNRGGDAFGLAFAYLRSSSEFKAQSLALDADGDGVPDYGYAAGDGEQLAELYYRLRLNAQIEVSPDIQCTARPGANATARSACILGVRAQVGF